MGRPGLKIVSSIDYDLQLQVDCVAATQLARLDGGDFAETLPAQDGQCLRCCRPPTPAPSG